MENDRVKASDEAFCRSCGEIIKKEAEICPKCGVRQKSAATNDISANWLTTLLLCLFLGVFGGHRFYAGKIGTAILMLLTFGGCGVWAIIDLIVILSGRFKDANGIFITKN